jgi:hypothetical protein
MAPVRGTVTFHGKPVAGASVAFLTTGAPRLAVGTTDESGNFRLTMFEPNDGAFLGTHVVTIRKLSSEPPATTPAAEAAADATIDSAAIDRAMEQDARAMMKARSELPAKYADRNTSDLHLDVVDGENVFEINLVD